MNNQCCCNPNHYISTHSQSVSCTHKHIYDRLPSRTTINWRVMLMNQFLSIQIMVCNTVQWRLTMQFFHSPSQCVCVWVGSVFLFLSSYFMLTSITNTILEVAACIKYYMHIQICKSARSSWRNPRQRAPRVRKVLANSEYRDKRHWHTHTHTRSKWVSVAWAHHATATTNHTIYRGESKPKSILISTA